MTFCPLPLPAPVSGSSRSAAWRSSTTPTYDSAAVMFDVMGFGKPIDETPMLLQPGVLSLAWGSVVRQLAAGLGIELDEVTEEHTRVPAPEDFDIAAGHIPAGTTAALRFEVRGMRDGKAAVVLEHVTRLRDDLCLERPQPAQEGGSYRVVVTGEPSYTLDLCLSSPNGDHNHAGLVATAAQVVNAIPAVVAADPGIRTTLDLPLITRSGSVRCGWNPVGRIAAMKIRLATLAGCLIVGGASAAIALAPWPRRNPARPVNLACCRSAR